MLKKINKMNVGTQSQAIYIICLFYEKVNQEKINQEAYEKKTLISVLHMK